MADPAGPGGIAQDEPILDTHEIQGNIFPGFNKSHQMLLGLRITDPAAARAWVHEIAREVASADEVVRFNQLRRQMIERRRHEPTGLVATWLSIAFSAGGLKKLGRQDVEDFEDDAFKAGLHQRSTLLGDPDDQDNVDGSTKNWKVGGSEETVPDVLLTVASDSPAHLTAKVRSIEAGLKRSADGRRTAEGSGLECFYQERGRDLPGALGGHEHFGFKDGISQPGVRGRLPDPTNPPLTRRIVAPNDPAAQMFASPGQPLVWPGQFVFGYPSQDALVPELAGADKIARPDWARNGSYLVYRRLRQNVHGFRTFLDTMAAEIAAKPGFADMTADKLAAQLVGRWPSGAPVLRSPLADDEAVGADSKANNHFTFDQPAAPIRLIVDGQAETVPGAPGDFDGLICTRASHIRKVNPRDLTTEQGNSSDVLTRRILRRGIPFGKPLPKGTAPADDPERGDRGLLFLCYQTSIVDQFEFLSDHWMNKVEAPEAGAGHDVLVGQNPSQAQQRVRRCTLQRVVDGQTLDATVSAPLDWIVPTGGGYFFAPSISAIRDVLGSAAGPA